MTNFEKYRDEIIERIHCGELRDYISKKIADDYCITLNKLLLSEKIMLWVIWLLDEYKEPETDWSKVEIDTPILVSIDGNRWYRRYFAKYENEVVHTFSNGYTSWTGDCISSWKYAKLPEKSEYENKRSE